METRVGVKIMTLTLHDGLSNAKGRLLESTNNVNSEHRREKIHKYSIDALLNNHALDNTINKHQHDLPLEDNPSGTDRRIGIMNVENTKVRKITCNL